MAPTPIDPAVAARERALGFGQPRPKGPTTPQEIRALEIRAGFHGGPVKPKTGAEVQAVAARTRARHGMPEPPPPKPGSAYMARYAGGRQYD